MPRKKNNNNTSSSSSSSCCKCCKCTPVRIIIYLAFILALFYAAINYHFIQKLSDLSHISLNSLGSVKNVKHNQQKRKMDNDDDDTELENKINTINKKIEILQQMKQNKKQHGRRVRRVVKKKEQHIIPPPPPPPPPIINNKKATSDVKVKKSERSASSSPASLSSININQGGILSNYINVKHGSIPILLLANNRPEQLSKTFESLLKVRGVSSKHVFMSQDGRDKGVKEVADRFNISSEQHIQRPVFGPPWKVGATRIARHYKWSLGNFFNKVNTETPCVIVVEDDLRFSPDFYEYFQAVGPVLDNDKTAWAVSAWNDNGFDYLMGHDKYRLLRTIFFPGLGWMMTRKLWKDQLEKTWPEEHWDHWLRSNRQHHNREVIYPEFPRVFHAGIKGTFMEKKTHKKYFARIATNYDANINWNINNEKAQKGILEASHDNYEQRLTNMVKKSMPLRTLSDFDHFDNKKYKAISIFITASTVDGQNRQFKSISSFFGIWHEHQRGSHCGVHEFSWCKPSNPKEKIRVFLINVHSSVKRERSCNYLDLKDRYFADTPTLDNHFFHASTVTDNIKSKCKGPEKEEPDRKK